MKAGSLNPVLQAILVADHVYTDQKSGKKIIAGVFHQLGVFKGGASRIVEQDGEKKKLVLGGVQSGSPYAYISLTSVRGKQPFIVRYVDLGQDQPLFQAEFQIECSDPLQTCEAVLALPKLPTPHAGTYALELLWQDEPIGLFRIQVQELRIEGQDDEHSGSD